MNFVSKAREFRPDLHLLSTVISCKKAVETMARLFDTDQVADCQNLKLMLKVKGAFIKKVMTAIVVRMMHAWMTVMLQLVAVTLLQTLRVTSKPLVMMVTTPEKMAHPVAPVGVAGKSQSKKRERRQRSHWQTREGRCRLQQ